MRLLGLSPLLTFVAFAVPAAVAALLYAVKWNNRRQSVAYVALWRRVASRSQSRQGIRRLESTLSFILQLVFIALLAFALGRPRMSFQTHEGRAIVFVVDNSASMRAIEGRTERLARARARVLDKLGDLAELDEAALVTTCPPQVLVPLGRARSPLRRALAQLAAVDAPGHLDDAVVQARAMLDARRAVDPSAPIALEIVTDGSEALTADTGGVPVDVDVVGKSEDNLGVTLLGARIDPLSGANARVLVEVGNFGPHRAHAELRVSLDDRLLDVGKLELAPGERHRQLLADVPEASRGRLVARLEHIAIEGGTDALAADDVAYALAPRRGEQRVVVVGSTGRFLDDALRANPRYQVTPMSLADWQRAPHQDAIVVIVGSLPPELPPGGYVLVAPKGGDLPFRADGVLERPSFTNWRDDHPILHATSLSDVAIARATRFVLAGGTTTLGGFLDDPLLFAVNDGRRRAVVFGFDLADSNLPLRASFPILLYNSIAWAAEARGDATRLELGRPTTLVSAAGGVRGPDGALATRRDGDRLVFTSQRAGFYETDDGQTTFAASVLDAGESAIAPARLASRHDPIARTRIVDHELWALLLLLALTLSCVEWWTYHRRVTS